MAQTPQRYGGSTTHHQKMKSIPSEYYFMDFSNSNPMLQQQMENEYMSQGNFNHSEQFKIPSRNLAAFNTDLIHYYTDEYLCSQGVDSASNPVTTQTSGNNYVFEAPQQTAQGGITYKIRSNVKTR